MFDRGRIRNGLVDYWLEVEDLPPVKSNVGRNDQFGFCVLNAVRAEILQLGSVEELLK